MKTNLARKLFIEYRKWDKIEKALSLLVLGIPFGVLGILKPSPAFSIQGDFAIFYVVGVYSMFMILDRRVVDIQRVLPELSIRIWNKWYAIIGAFMIWWFAIFAVAYSKSIFLLDVWINAPIFIFGVIPAIFSLAVFVPVGNYISCLQNSLQDRKKIAGTMTLLSIVLGMPFIFAVFWPVIMLTDLPYWVYYVLALSSYIAIFFSTIDIPFYLGAEEEKKRKLKGLDDLRTTLIEKLCNNDWKTLDFNARVAVELNIMRIDREKEEIKSVTSHPFGLIKPIASYFIVSVATTIVLQVIFKVANL